jgi:adenosine deaminase
LHLPDLTIHAGELEGADAVERALALAPQAIGHGVRSLEEPATVDRLAKSSVTLEVCPTSNRLLIAADIAALEQAYAMTPLRALQIRHVRCVLGSDDPTVMGTSFRRELEVARREGVDLDRIKADSERRWTEMTGQTPREKASVIRQVENGM